MILILVLQYNCTSLEEYFLGCIHVEPQLIEGSVEARRTATIVTSFSPGHLHATISRPPSTCLTLANANAYSTVIENLLLVVVLIVGIPVMLELILIMVVLLILVVELVLVVVELLIESMELIFVVVELLVVAVSLCLVVVAVVLVDGVLVVVDLLVLVVDLALIVLDFLVRAVNLVTVLVDLVLVLRVSVVISFGQCALEDKALTAESSRSPGRPR
jgi:hypothetical protein